MPARRCCLKTPEVDNIAVAEGYRREGDCKKTARNAGRRGESPRRDSHAFGSPRIQRARDESVSTFGLCGNLYPFPILRRRRGRGRHAKKALRRVRFSFDFKSPAAFSFARRAEVFVERSFYLSAQISVECFFPLIESRISAERCFPSSARHKFSSILPFLLPHNLSPELFLPVMPAVFLSKTRFL